MGATSSDSGGAATVHCGCGALRKRQSVKLREYAVAVSNDAKPADEANLEAANGKAGEYPVQLTANYQIADIANQCTDAEIETCMKQLDTGNATALCELACCCLSNSMNDESVHRIADSTAFKTELNELARNHANGLAEPDSDSAAIQLSKFVENQNNPDVLCALGKAHKFNQSVRKDVSKAIEYYTKAADFGSYEATERLGKCKKDSVGEYLTAAFEHFRQLTDSGDANAQFAVACCRYWGIGTRQNRWLAIKMCQSAENKQNNNMVVLLGWLYYFGHGVKKNAVKAVELFKQTAEAGNKEGQFQLGSCYYSAVGVAQDYKQAAFWYEKAAAQGHAKAADILGDCYENGYGVEKDITKAFQYYRQAAIAGDICGQNNTGDDYYYGKSVYRSQKPAICWYQKAADQGEIYAALEFSEWFAWLRKIQNINKYILQIKMTQSASTNQQHVIGFYLAKLAADHGCSKAYSWLGDCYSNGVGTAKSLRGAAENYNKAYQREPALLGCDQILNLVVLYQNEQTDNKNEVSAFVLLQHVNSMLRVEINAILFQMQ